MSSEAVTGVPHYFLTVDGSASPERPAGVAIDEPVILLTFYLHPY